MTVGVMEKARDVKYVDSTDVSSGNEDACGTSGQRAVDGEE